MQSYEVLPNNSAQSVPSKQSRRGFASMDPARRRELARRGGQTAQKLGRAHRFTSEEAKDARVKSVQARNRNRLMKEVGSESAESSQ
jgi:uncharacterized protein